MDQVAPLNIEVWLGRSVTRFSRGGCFVPASPHTGQMGSVYRECHGIIASKAIRLERIKCWSFVIHASVWMLGGVICLESDGHRQESHPQVTCPGRPQALLQSPRGLSSTWA